MLQLKTKSTNRKFYGKWLYKVSLLLDGCAMLRTYAVEDIPAMLNTYNEDESAYFSSHRKAMANKDSIINLCEGLAAHTKETYALRIERSRLDIYTNDVDFYEELSIRCQTELIHRFQPSAGNVEILKDSHNSITVDKLPKGRYQYRVYLLPHKMSKDREGKQKYLNWLKLQQPKVTCTTAIERWFLTTDWNWDRRYILVEDESMLLMLKLRSAEVMGRVYNFVVCDK
jgi:hypothetical protein